MVASYIVVYCFPKQTNQSVDHFDNNKYTIISISLKALKALEALKAISFHFKWISINLTVQM